MLSRTWKMLIIPSRFFGKINKKQQEKINKQQQKSKARSNIQNSQVIDFVPIQQIYQQAIEPWESSLKDLRIKTISTQFFKSMQIKEANKMYAVTDLCQITIQNSSTAILTPFDPDSTKTIIKSLQKLNYSIQITPRQSDIQIKMDNSTKEFKQSLIKQNKQLFQKLKQDLKRVRAQSAKIIKKYQKICQKDKFKQAEKELSDIHERKSQSCQKVFRSKEKQIKEL